MIACPNKSSKSWKDLVSQIGEFEATRQYMLRNDGNIPSVAEALGLNSIEKFSKIEDAAEVKLMAQEAAESLMEFLNNKFPGVEGAIINDREQKWKGKLVNGKTPTINLAYAEVSDGFHEFAHPFLMSLRKSNPELFNNLYQDLKASPEWQTISSIAQSKVERLYPELTGADSSLFKEEVLATAIGYAAERKTTESKEKISRNLGRVIDDIFKWLNSFINEIFSKNVNVTNLSSTTTFGEVIDLLTDYNSKFLLDADWTKLVENYFLGDAMVGAITTNQEAISDVLNGDLSNAMVANERLDIDSFINQWLDKTFKLPKKDYVPRKVSPNQLAYSIAQTMLEQAVVRGYQLTGSRIKNLSKEKTLALPYSSPFTEATIQKLASVLQPIQLNYKFANYLTNKKNISISLKQPFVTIKETEVKQQDGSIDIQQSASIPMTIQEAGVVKDFQVFLTDKYPDRKSMTADQINDEYIQWVTDNYGIDWTEAIGHDRYGMDRIIDNASKLNSYTRILFVDDYFNQNGHSFQIKGAGLNGNGIGWYVKAEIDGERFDHEFQSDILPEIRKSFKKGEYESSETRKLETTTPKSRLAEIQNLARQKLTQTINAAGDFLLLKCNYLSDKIFKVDGQENITNNELLNNDDFEDNLAFSKIDNLDPFLLEEDKKFLLSEVDVNIEQLKSNKTRWINIAYSKGRAKIFNLWLSRKSDDQQELFDWVKTFDVVKYVPNFDDEYTESIFHLDNGDDLPFSKIEGTEYRKLITTIASENIMYRVYATSESINKFPKSLKKILDQSNEWANSGAPIKPDIIDIKNFRNQLCYTAVRLIDPRTLAIAKNYGFNKKKITAERDIVKKDVDKNFKAYKFAMGRLKALEFRKNVYANTSNIVKIAEYYKGQYNRFYKFYDSMYDEAEVIAREKASNLKEEGKDENYTLYKKYNDLFDNWFNIIVPQSINSAKAEGRTHYYLPTASAMNAVEGNSRAEEVYWTPDDNKTLNNVDVDIRRVVSKYISQNTPEVNDALRNYLTPAVIRDNNINQDSTADEIAYVIINKTNFTNESEDFIKFKDEEISKNAITKPNGPLYNALVKYARKNNIKLTFEQPGWSKHTLIKVDLTKYEAKPIDRFSKTDDGFITNEPIENNIEYKTEIPSDNEQQQIIGGVIANTIAAELANNFGVSFQIVTAEEARELTKDTEVPWNGEPAFFFNGKVYFTQDGFNTENILHEYAHPLVDCLHIQNPKLFNKLVSDLLATAEGQQILEDVTKAYGEIDITDPRFAKEILVRGLAKEAQLKVQEKQTTKEFKNFIDKFLFSMKQFLRKVFGTPIKIEKLSTKTTLKELASMLASEKFNINTDLITHADYVEFARNVDKEVASLEAVDDAPINELINLFYKLGNSQNNQMSDAKGTNYVDAKNVLINDQTRIPLIEEINATLAATPELRKEGVDRMTPQEIRKGNVENFVHAMKRLEIMTQKTVDHLDKLATQGDSPEVMRNLFYYDLLSRNWTKFIKEVQQKLFVDNNLRQESEFGKDISIIASRMETIQSKVQKAYGPSVIKQFEEILAPLAEGINKYYQDQIDKLNNSKDGIGWGDKQKYLKKIQDEWDSQKLTKERIKDLLYGKTGDTNVLSALLEDYTNSPDPIVGGFAIFVKNAYSDVDAQFQRDANDLTREIAPLLEQLGYSKNNFRDIMSQLVFKDEVPFYNSDTDKFEIKEVYSFLNPFKNVSTILNKFMADYEKAVAEGNQADADSILKQIKQHQKDYFHQEYVDAYYEKDDVYDSLDKNKDLEDEVYKIMGVDKASATAAQRAEAAAMYDRAAKEAYRNKHTILNTITTQQSANYEEATYDETAQNIKLLWRAYSQLASLTNMSGDPKTGEVLLASMIENKYRKVTREMYEWNESEGLFEFNLNNYEQKLISSGYPAGTPEFNEKRQQWIKDNTVVKFTKEFYDERNQILSDIRAIMDRIGKTNPTMKERLDSTKEMEEFLDIAMGYRDTDGQIMGNDVTERGKERIKELQQDLIDKKEQLAGISGLNKAESQELDDLFSIVSAKQPLSPAQRTRFDDLLNKKSTNSIDKATKTELTALYNKLFEIQSREATDYYVDILNTWLEKMGEVDLIDNFTAGSVLRPEKYVDLLSKDADFKKWFEKNHIKKEIYDHELGRNIMVYERLFVWNRTRPNNAEHYESTKLENGEVIQGVPNLSFFKRDVKQEYRTEEIVGKTVNNRGNRRNKWLPKTIADGAKADSPYINADYEKLKKADPTLFKLLEKMKEFHLKFQEDIPSENRLYLQVPRYLSRAGENLNLKGGSRWLQGVKNLFIKSKTDYDVLQLNYMVKNQLIQAETMFSEDLAKIPITGITDLEPDEVSMDLLDGMLKYRHSGLMHKKLLELNPFAQSLKKILNDPKNLPIETSKWSKFLVKSAIGKIFPSALKLGEKGLKQTGKKQDFSIRASAVNNFYEREFEGKKVTGIFSNTPFAWRIKAFVSKLTSIPVFGFNIVSAVKNRQAAIVEAYIEAGGGRFLNYRSQALGKIKAVSMMAENSVAIYSYGNRSLNLQMMQIFDTGQEFLERSVHNQFGRSLKEDAANFSFLMSPRKFLQFEATVEIMCGMLYHRKVTQTINGNKNEINYIDAFEIRNGQIELKPGIDPEYAAGGKKFKEIKNQIHEVSNRLEGNYSRMGQPEINRYYIGQLGIYMKKFFTAMGMNQIAATRPSVALGTMSSGNYVAAVKMVKNILSYGPRYYTWASADQVAGFRKTIARVACMMLLEHLLKDMLGYDDDDFKKSLNLMKARSGDLNTKDFKPGGWAQNQAIVMTLMTLTENETWINPFILAPQLKDQYLGWGPLYDRGVKAPVKILYHAYGALAGKDNAFYSRDIGPYSFQKQESAKVWKDIADMFGLTGNQVSPVKQIQATHSARQLNK
jgi:hypothetical protein